MIFRILNNNLIWFEFTLGSNIGAAAVLFLTNDSFDFSMVFHTDEKEKYLLFSFCMKRTEIQFWIVYANFILTFKNFFVFINFLKKKNIYIVIFIQFSLISRIQLFFFFFLKLFIKNIFYVVLKIFYCN